MLLAQHKKIKKRAIKAVWYLLYIFNFISKPTFYFLPFHNSSGNKRNGDYVFVEQYHKIC